VVPVRAPDRPLFGSWKGLVEVHGDIVHVDWSDDFDATRADGGGSETKTQRR
jgi:hypothetical protein